MLGVMLLLTTLCAAVLLDSLEIPSPLADSLLVSTFTIIVYQISQENAENVNLDSNTDRLKHFSITLFHLLDEPKPDICSPGSCGPGALASPSQGVCKCTCSPGLQGDPYHHGCKPECIINTDCTRDLACSNNKCVNPCPGTCGQHATCSVINHIPTCVCKQGFVGNAFEECVKSKHDQN